MLYGALLASLLMDVLLKQLGAGVGVWTIVAWRWTLGAVMLLPLAVMRFGKSDWRLFDHVHLMRAVLNLIGTYGLIYGLQNLPLVLVITIFFTEPLLTLILATIIGRQPLHALQLVISTAGLVGVGLATVGESGRMGYFQPDVMIAAGIALAGAFAGALMTVVTQVHGRTSSSLSLVFWTAMPAAGVGIAMAGQSALNVSLTDMWRLALVAALGCIFSLLWVKAIKLVSARVAAHIMYLSLPLGALAGWYFFGELPHTVSVVGSVSVFLAVLAANRLTAKNTVTA